MKLMKEKAESKVIRSCRCSSVWDSTEHCWQSTPASSKENLFSLFWMISTCCVRHLRPDLPPLEDGDIYQPKHGWQHLASRCTDFICVHQGGPIFVGGTESDVAFTGRPTGCVSIHVRAMGPPGLHTTARELQTCTFEGPGASNTTKIPREDPQRKTKRAKMGRERDKTARNFGLPTLRGLHPSGPHRL